MASKIAKRLARCTTLGEAYSYVKDDLHVSGHEDQPSSRTCAQLFGVSHAELAAGMISERAFLPFWEAVSGAPEVREVVTEAEEYASYLAWKEAGLEAMSSKKSAPKRTPKVTKIPNAITAGDAWKAAGSLPDFEPKDKNAPARNVLVRLNAAGKLRLA